MGGFAGILQVTSFAFCWDSRFDLLFSWLLPYACHFLLFLLSYDDMTRACSLSLIT